MAPLIYTVDASTFEIFSRADGRLRTLDRMLTPAEVILADKVRTYGWLPISARETAERYFFGAR